MSVFEEVVKICFTVIIFLFFVAGIEGSRNRRRYEKDNRGGNNENTQDH